MVFFEYYKKKLMGTQPTNNTQIHWPNLYPPQQQHDLSALQSPISKTEIEEVIRSWPNNKSPGQNGFTVKN